MKTVDLTLLKGEKVKVKSHLKFKVKILIINYSIITQFNLKIRVSRVVKKNFKQKIEELMAVGPGSSLNLLSYISSFHWAMYVVIMKSLPLAWDVTGCWYI